VTLEREAKFAVGPMFRVPDLDDVVEGAAVTTRAPVRFVTTYLDTPDLRLARWGASLRYRTGEGWTVKLPQPGDGVLVVRDELTFEGGPAKPPEPALDMVRAYVRTASVRVAVRLQTVRTATQIEDDNGKPLAELVDDEVSVLDGRRVAARFREVEVEMASGADDTALRPVVERLAAAGAGEPSSLPKAVRALLPRSGMPAEVVTGDPRPSSTVIEVVRSALALSVLRILRHDAGVRLGDDPEAVHQARVATRRLRSDLRTFRSLLDPAWTHELRDELGWLGGELGVVRDLDVLGERLRAEILSLSDADAETAPKLLDRVRSAHDAARAGLLSAMREPRYLWLLDRAVAAAGEPAVVPEAAQERAVDAMGALMRGPWSHLVRACDDLGPSSSDAELHDARIRAKRVRYAAEALIPVFGKPAKRFARRAESLQGVLGEHQDAVMAIAWLRQQAGGTTARVAFTAGALAGVEARHQAGARAAWPEAWRRLSSKKVRFWT
jgi:CHAD domain-containing protein